MSGRRLVSAVLCIIATVIIDAAYPVAAYLTDDVVQEPVVHEPPMTGAYHYNDFRPEGSLDFPELGHTYVDPVFHTKIGRMTDEYSEFSNSHIYVKNGFWNQNGTKFLHMRPDGAWVIIETLTGIDTLLPTDVSAYLTEDASFAPDDPDVLYYFKNNAVMRYPSNGMPVVKDFGSTLQPLGGTSDWIDRTGRYMLVQRSNEVVVFDRILDREYSGIGVTADDNWKAISPDGKYVIITDSNSDDGWQHRSHVIDHQNYRVSTSAVIFWTLCGDHGDLVTATNGITYFVTFACADKNGIYAVDVSKSGAAPSDSDNLFKNARILLPDSEEPGGLAELDNDGHISGVSAGPLKNWVVVSLIAGPRTDGTFDDPFCTSTCALSPWRPYKQEILAINVITKEIRRLAHHRSRGNFHQYYRAQPRISISWYGDFLGWASNYNRRVVGEGHTNYVDLYRIKTPIANTWVALPLNNAILSGIATLDAKAEHNIAVTKVQFTLDGVVIAATLAPPWSVEWDTRSVVNGTYTLRAVGHDAQGNKFKSDNAVTVTIDN